MFDFTGKIAVVTGGEMGIGKAAALALAQQGAKVILAGINDAEGKKTASLHGDIFFFHTDVTKEHEVSQLAAEVKKTHGPATVLINSAGIHGKGKAADTELSLWNSIMTVNVTGVFLMCKAFIPQMIEAGSGSIVNVASEAGLVAIPEQIAYNTSKTAVIGLTKSLAIDYADKQIRANAICPGTTHTPLVEQALIKSGDPKGTLKELESSRPANRLGRPEEIAAAIIALASDDIAYATGAVFSVDGGLTAQ